MGMILYSSAIPEPVNIYEKFYGPSAVTSGSRDQYKHQFSESVSLSDDVIFKNNIATLKNAVTSSVPSPYLARKLNLIKNTNNQLQIQAPGRPKDEVLSEAVKKVIENDSTLKDNNRILLTNQKELNEWLNPEILTEKYTHLIEEHLSRKAGNFLFQLANCFGTRLHFEVGKTQDQGESAKTLEAELNGNVYNICVRNAAHGSAFPCLKAYDGADWDRWVLSNYRGSAPPSIDYLKDSDMYKSENSTIAMPRCINEADMKVEGWHHNSNFSKTALNLINEAAKGSISLPNAMKIFLETYATQISEQLKAYQNPGIRKALEIFSKTVLDIRKEFKANPNEWVLTQLDLIPSQQQTDSLVATIMRLRCEAIKRNMRGQTEILAKVNALADTVLEQIKNQKKLEQIQKGVKKLTNPRAPDHFQESFKAVVIDTMRTNEDKVRIKQLFALNETSSRSSLDNTKAKIIQIALPAIQSLARTISLDMRSLQKDEIAHRGDSMKILREAKKWSRDTLGTKLKERYPTQYASTSTIRRTEIGERIMDTLLATQLSDIFEVPKELLLPQFFFV